LDEKRFHPKREYAAPYCLLSWHDLNVKSSNFKNSFIYDHTTLTHTIIMNHSDRIKYIATQLFEKGNLNLVESAFSEDYLAHAGEKSYQGIPFIKQFIKQLRTAIPDLKIVKMEILSLADQAVTWQIILSGTHKAPLKGIPASDKKVKWYEIVVSRFENDKIAEEWLNSDLALQLMLKQK